MTGTFRSFFILIFILAIAGAETIYAVPENFQSPPVSLIKTEAEMALKRSKFVMTDKVWDLIAIKPGITILDLGTGTGQFAYEFAERLKNTGKVYATDVFPDRVHYVKEEAARRGLTNLYPVLVNAEGLDEFYGKHRFDMIALFNVFTGEYEGAVHYLKGLRASLAEGGRLIVMDYRRFRPFSAGDFSDFKGLVRELSQEPSNSPYVRGLRGPARNMIKDNQGEGPDEELKKMIVEDFNQALSDGSFYLNFVEGNTFDKKVAFSPEEKDWVAYLLQRLIQERFFEKGRNKEMSPPAGRQVLTKTYIAQMNKLLIIQKFRQYLRGDRMFLSDSSEGIRSAFEKAGYKLEKDYGDLIFCEDLLVFTIPPVLSSAAEKSKDKQTDELAKQGEYKEPVAGMEFVFVKGGCYEMGDYRKRVCVDDFYMGKYDVTQGQWKEIMGDNPSNFRDCGDDCPVEFVSWNDVQEFIKKLNSRGVFEPRPYRLPTEAEWEYAARSGGRKEKWAGTNSEPELGDYAWYVNNSGNKTHPVGSKKPNGLGLYDMSGNVWQCMQDRLDESPQAPGGEGNIRMLRGGSWSMGAWFARTAFRIALHPDVRGNDIGFRLARGR